ncbi:hypothetical protein CL614_05305 [archaeon]|nr:hypothetical protein [archaeon]|tara:strand:- start:787 stop:1131 length:345 start_codon:yes stop_codon:yes gene_type:complete
MKDIHIQITGIHDEDDFVKEGIDKAVESFVQKAGELFKKCDPCEQSLDVVVKSYNVSGGNDKRSKYSVHTRLQTPIGLIVSESSGFGKLLGIVQECLNKLERELKQKHDKTISK